MISTISFVKGVLIGIIVTITCMIYKRAPMSFELPICMISATLLCIVSYLDAGSI
jgi:hypothetical protein